MIYKLLCEPLILKTVTEAGDFDVMIGDKISGVLVINR